MMMVAMVHLKQDIRLYPQEGNQELTALLAWIQALFHPHGKSIKAGRGLREDVQNFAFS
jgi:hypothetical protein